MGDPNGKVCFSYARYAYDSAILSSHVQRKLCIARKLLIVSEGNY